jgi:hypothetical protein
MIPSELYAKSCVPIICHSKRHNEVEVKTKAMVGRIEHESTKNPGEMEYQDVKRQEELQDPETLRNFVNRKPITSSTPFDLAIVT